MKESPVTGVMPTLLRESVICARSVPIPISVRIAKRTAFQAANIPLSRSERLNKLLRRSYASTIATSSTTTNSQLLHRLIKLKLSLMFTHGRGIHSLLRLILRMCATPLALSRKASLTNTKCLLAPFSASLGGCATTVRPLGPRVPCLSRLLVMISLLN